MDYSSIGIFRKRGSTIVPVLRQLWLIGSLLRFSHTLFALPFALAAVVLALPYGVFSWQRLGWIVVCIVSARTAAMAFNRLVDRRIDELNPRTRSREIPTGKLGVREVRLIVFFSCAVFVFGCTQLGRLSLLLCPLVLILVLGYSYAKRFTTWCHLILGLAIALAPGGAWIAMGAPVNTPAPYILVFAVALWVAGFDILYALQDLNFDEKAGLYSVPVRWGIRRSLWISAGLHALTVALLVLLGLHLGRGLFYFAGVAFVGLTLIYEHAIVRPDDLSRLNHAFFTANGFVSVGFFVATLCDAFV